MPSQVPLSRSELRQLIRAVLPTDSDFTAFCGDYFPDVAARLGNGMDRVAKTSLLLVLVEPPALAEALQQAHPKMFAQHARRGTAEPTAGKNPYRGLAAFQLQEAHLFFGRDALTGQLWQRFEALHDKPDTVRLLAVVGPSGSGKSSVARAGLLAALLRSPVPGPQPMRFAILKPGERPIESLARSLVPLLPADSAVLPARRQVEIEQLLRDPNIAAQGLRRFAVDLPEVAASPLVVLVDQCEELYTLCKDPLELDLFVKTLLHAASDASCNVSVVLTLRSDFLGETQRQNPELSSLIAAQHELVLAMSPDELRDAIAKPAEIAGRQIDDATIELLLTEARGSQGALPLLEFALTRIWEGMQRGEEPGATLRTLGGVGGALAGEAQKIYDGLTSTEQATARRALVRLVRLGEGTRDTRRRAQLRDLCGQGQTEADVLAVLRKFASENARLVTLGGDGGETLAEVTHEALFDHWTELRTWIEQSRKDRGLYDRALEAAKLWIRDGKPAGRLWRPPDLDLLHDYQRRKPEDFGPMVAEFLVAAQRRQKTEWALSLGAVAAVIAALLIAAGVYVAKERQRTRDASAAQERIHRQLLDSYVERGSQLLFENGKPSEGLLWLHRAKREGSQDPALPDLLRSAMQPVDATRAVLIGHGARVLSATYSPDGRRILTASEDNTARVWETDGGRLLLELKGHGASVVSAAFSPDGRRVVTASWDKTARVWEAQSGRLLAELKGHEASVNNATYSPDGRRILTASSDETARVWEADGSRLLAELKGHEASVNSATYSPDGHRILTASLDKTARVWEADGGRLLVELKGHGASVVSATFSPDGLRILTASEDNTARVWETDGGRLLAELKGHGASVVSAAFSPDGRRILTASWDNTARVWETDGGRLLAELKGHGAGVVSAAFSPDGRRILTASYDKTARAWEADSGQLLAEFKGHGDSVVSARFSPDGRRILTASEDRTARVWETDGGQLLAELDSHGAGVVSARFSPDGRRILTETSDKTARVWEAQGGRLLAEFKGHGAGVGSARFSPDGRRILTAGDDETARVWEADGGRLLVELKGHEYSVASARFSPDGRRILTESYDKTARVWEADGGRLLAELKGSGSRVVVARFSPDGRRILIASSDSTARVWEADGGRLLTELKGHGASVVSACFSPDGRRILSANHDNTTRVWEADGGRLLAELKSHGDRVLSATYSPDGRRILTASDDKTARVWEADGGQLLAELKGHGDSVREATFSPDSRRILTTSEDHTARVWEADGGRLLAELKGHGDSIRGATFSPDGRRILTASYDNTARVWETDGGRLLAELKSHGASVLSATFSPDGRRILTVSLDETVRVWDLASETRTTEQLAKLIRCHVPAQFERDGSSIIVFRMPTPAECQNAP